MPSKDLLDQSVIKMLVVEDNATDIRIFKEILNRQSGFKFEIEWADTAQKAIQCLSHAAPDVIILDLSLPDSEGIGTFSKIYNHSSQIPIVILSASVNEAVSVEAVHRGAQDYLVKKEVSRTTLLRAVRYAIERKRIEIELQKYREDLEQLVQKRTAELSEANKELKNEISERVKAEKSLEAKNIALREILAQLEQEKKALGDKVIANADHSLMPLIQQLRTCEPKHQKRYLDLLEKNLKELTSTFGIVITRKAYALTPRELKICSMIKDGLTTKEISTLHNTSFQTVEKHRNRIRKKLGLSHKSVNLSTFLQSI